MSPATLYIGSLPASGRLSSCRAGPSGRASAAMLTAPAPSPNRRLLVATRAAQTQEFDMSTVGERPLMATLTALLVGEPVSAPTQKVDPKAVAEKVYAAYAKGGSAALMELLDPNVQWVSPSMPGGPWKGREGVAEFFKALESMGDTQRFHVDSLLGDSKTGKAVAVVNLTASSTSSEKSCSLQLIQIWTVNSKGLITRFEEIGDDEAYTTCSAKWD